MSNTTLCTACETQLACLQAGGCKFAPLRRVEQITTIAQLHECQASDMREIVAEDKRRRQVLSEEQVVGLSLLMLGFGMPASEAVAQ